MSYRYLLVAVFFSIFACPPQSWSEEAQETGKIKMSESMETMLLFFEESDLIVTATKHPQKLSEAPAIATVISGDEIRRMGARDLMDVLRIIPGIGISINYQGLPEIEVRGIKSAYSERVKIMIDGHSVNDNITGGATWIYGDLNVDNINRIEVIRGPGSALYGSNAFSAVINIITRDGKDLNGTLVSMGGGSYNTWKGNLQAGKKWDGIESILTLNYLTSDGSELSVDSDRATRSGDTDEEIRKVDAGFKFKFKDFSFNSRYIAKKRGPYLGVGYAVNDETEIEMWKFFGEAEYKHEFNKSLRISAKAYLDDLYWNGDYEIFSEDAVPLPGSWPDGMLGSPEARERILGAELQATIDLADGNILTAGAVLEGRKQFDVKQTSNYDPLTFSPLGTIHETANWNQEKERQVWAAYVQDSWEITNKINLTMGIRHDHYSDFGSANSPRAAVVWQFKEGWDAKLLYGQAFRAPSFQELYNINNPVEWGNEDLDAERMTTYEASLGYKHNSRYSSRLSYCNNTFRDRIILVADESTGIQYYENQGGANVQGAEFELRREFGKSGYIYANYTYQWPEDDETGERLADVPLHKGNIGGNAALSRHINANVNIYASGERFRADGDSRDDLPAYALVDLALVGKDFIPNLELRGTVYNLLDKEYEDPSPINTMYSDFPREGITFMIDASYKF